MVFLLLIYIYTYCINCMWLVPLTIEMKKLCLMRAWCFHALILNHLNWSLLDMNRLNYNKKCAYPHVINTTLASFLWKEKWEEHRRIETNEYCPLKTNANFEEWFVIGTGFNSWICCFRFLIKSSSMLSG